MDEKFTNLATLAESQGNPWLEAVEFEGRDSKSQVLFFLIFDNANVLHKTDRCPRCCMLTNGILLTWFGEGIHKAPVSFHSSKHSSTDFPRTSHYLKCSFLPYVQRTDVECSDSPYLTSASRNPAPLLGQRGANWNTKKKLGEAALKSALFVHLPWSCCFPSQDWTRKGPAFAHSSQLIFKTEAC